MHNMNWRVFLYYSLHNFLSLPKTIWFNFHYLPFSQAIHFPVFCYKVRLRVPKGKVIIASNEIKTGMILLGKDIVGIYPNNGVVFESKGDIIFRGTAIFGNSCSISVGRNGTLDIGNSFIASAATKIVCASKIIFKENVRLGWETLIMDTSFHRLKGLDGKFKGKGYGEIVLGKNNWFGSRCTVLSGVKTPDYCVIGAGTILNKDILDYPTHIMVAGNPAKLKKRDVYRDVNDDKLDIVF